MLAVVERVEHHSGRRLDAAGHLHDQIDVLTGGQHGRIIRQNRHARGRSPFRPPAPIRRGSIP